MRLEWRYRRPLTLGALTLALLCSGTTISAQSVDELDALVTADEATGLALANAQAERGDWLEGLATLDRLLAQFPKSRPARLLQAVWLCRIDDRPGGIVALGKLKRKHYDRTDWNAAQTACGLPEPRR